MTTADPLPTVNGVGKHRKLVSTPAPTPAAPQAAPSRRQRRVALRRQHAERTLRRLSTPVTGGAVACAFDSEGFYVRLADRILDRLPWHLRIRHKGHALCVCLHDLTTGLESSRYAKLAQIPLHEALLRLRFPRFLADLMTSREVFGDKPILGALPARDLATTLTAVVPLTCPDLDRCPARGDVLRTYNSPASTERLRALAG